MLRGLFERAGCAIVEDVKKRFDSGEVTLDGWCEARRLGYEFITTEEGDRAEFTPEVLAEIEARMSKGEFFIFLVDEATIDDPAILERAGERFLQAVAKR